MKHLTVNDVRDLGVIMEVNRLLLHPRGLALEVTWDDRGIDNEKVAMLRVQDHRDDPEGVYFGDFDDADEAKHLAFDDLLALTSAREAALGFIVEPFKVGDAK